MSNDTIQVTLNRTDVETIRSLLRDAEIRNEQEGAANPYKFSKPWYEKRAITCRFLVRKLSKAKDRRRKHLDLSDELFPVSK